MTSNQIAYQKAQADLRNAETQARRQTASEGEYYDIYGYLPGGRQTKITRFGYNELKSGLHDFVGGAVNKFRNLKEDVGKAIVKLFV